jgi:predicted Zn-dependent peptidase
MLVRLTAAAALFALAFTGTAFAAPVKTLTLGTGATQLYTQSDEGALLAGIQIFVRAGLDHESARENGLAALAAETILGTKVGGIALSDAVAAHGGAIVYSVGPQYVRYYLEAPPASMGSLAVLVLNAKIAEDESNPVSAGLEMLRQSYYDGGAGLPTFGTTATLQTLAGADVRAFIAAHYRRGNVIASAVGNVSPSVMTAVQTIATALPEGVEAPVATTARAFSATPKKIFTHRDIGVPYLVMGFAAPSLREKDFGAMLILRSLLGDVFDRPSATTLPVYSRAVGVVYTYDANPASLAIYVNGAQLDPSAGLGGVEGVLQGVMSKPLPADLLKRYRTSAHGEWLTESVTLSDQAWAIGNFVAFGGGPDDAQNVAAAIEAATAADVQRVAKTYLQRFTVAVVMPRSAPNPN